MPRWPGDASEDEPGRGVLSFRPALFGVGGGVGGGALPRRRTTQASPTALLLLLGCFLVGVA